MTPDELIQLFLIDSDGKPIEKPFAQDKQYDNLSPMSAQALWNEEYADYNIAYKLAVRHAITLAIYFEQISRGYTLPVYGLGKLDWQQRITELKAKI